MFKRIIPFLGPLFVLGCVSFGGYYAYLDECRYQEQMQLIEKLKELEREGDEIFWRLQELELKLRLRMEEQQQQQQQQERPPQQLV